jgi:hypothetical protein
MRREDVQDFHRPANEARDAVYGITAYWNARALSMACHVMTEMELAAGGYERSGTIRAIYSGLDGPGEHEEVRIEDPITKDFGQRWVVLELTPSAPHNSTSYTLAPIP